MARVGDCAKTLRSKNAGAFLLTIDIVLKSAEFYKYVCASPVFTPGVIAKLYHVAACDVQIIPYPQVNSIKVTMPRNIASGDIGDSDVYGAQQHVLLMQIELDG